MTNILLIASVLPFFLFGFYIVKKVDEFILENKKRMSEEIQMLEPSFVILPGDLPLMEIDKEIDKKVADLNSRPIYQEYLRRMNEFNNILAESSNQIEKYVNSKV